MMTTAGVCGGQSLEPQEFPTLVIVTRGGKQTTDLGSGTDGSNETEAMGIDDANASLFAESRGGMRSCLR